MQQRGFVCLLSPINDNEIQISYVDQILKLKYAKMKYY